MTANPSAATAAVAASRAAERVYNFNPGPAVLPLPVLEEVQRDLLALPGAGMSILEISHRAKEFDAILGGAEADLRKLLGLSENYQMIFLGGGASLQFAMVAMNFLPGDGSADYIISGHWAQQAVKEAKKLGKVNIAASTETEGFVRVPRQEELRLDPGAAYVHFTSNNTIYGTEAPAEPEVGGVPLVCDASSNFLSRVIDPGKYALIYAGAQKNIGPAGLTIVIVREDLLGQPLPTTPSVFDYKVQAEADSMHNTPPTFAVYIAGLVFQWLKKLGGLKKMEEINAAKARLVYDYLDQTEFYHSPVAREDRSRMNIPFTLRNAALDGEFLKQAERHGLTQLKGHRSVGGMRASLYNAMPIEGVHALVAFMREFERNHG